MGPVIKRKIFSILMWLKERKERLFFRRKLSLLAGYQLSEINVPGFKGCFFGYYDVSPFNIADSNILIFHAVDFSPYVKPSSSKKVSIILYNMANKSYKVIDETETWNWQQGARLQWLDENVMVYNKLVDGKLRGCSYNIKTGVKKVYPVNVSIAFKNEFILSNNYNLLSKHSEYGYYGNIQLESNGIQLLNLKSGKVQEIIDLASLRSSAPENTKAHHVNHLLPNSNGELVIFIYRYYSGNTRYDDLYLYDVKTQELTKILSETVLSHYCWMSESELLIWMKYSSELAYFTIDFSLNKVKKVMKESDGHPNKFGDKMFISDRCHFNKLFDRFQDIYTYDLEKQDVIRVLEINNANFFDKQVRCDVHISALLSGEKFQFDSFSKRKHRSIYVCNRV